jgi:hypothetical protein
MDCDFGIVGVEALFGIITGLGRPSARPFGLSIELCLAVQFGNYFGPRVD